MFSLIIYLSGLLVSVAAGFLAARSDLRGFTIPNLYSFMIGGGYIACFVLLSLTGQTSLLPPLFSSLLAALLFFCISFAMFALNILGAADSKLGTAYAFWIGLAGLPAFLFYMTIFGAFIAVFSLVLRKFKPFKNPPVGTWFEQAQSGSNKIPYGVAIFTGMLVSFINLGYFKYETFVSFFSG